MPQSKSPLNPLLTERARCLRKDATVPERFLWGLLRDDRLAGLKFRRQHPIGPFVVDFFCHAVALVVEVDGISHDGRAAADSRRTEYLERQGLRVLRIGNDEVLKEREAVAMAILRAVGVGWQ